jgi:CRISPR-associated endonuclease/helicase Cas3
MQPVHAALAACDSLILLDEAHVTKAFSQTLGLLNRYRQLDTTSPPMRFVQMTATPAGDIPEDKRFSLKGENWSDPRNKKLKERQEAHKLAELVSTGKKSIVDEIVKRSIAAVEGPRQAIGIIVNRVQTARDIHSKLAEQFGEDVHLVIGRMRPVDRDQLQEQLRTLVGPGRPETLPKPCFVVATKWAPTTISMH